MENTKQRCHFSIVLERSGKLLSFLIILIFTQLDDVIKMVKGIGTLEMKEIFTGSGIFVILFFVVLIYNLLVWSKTYIWVEDMTIIVERNTFFSKKKNAYGIRSISNINIEQTIFERLMGTVALKIDTNSASTAGKTDIKIVFSRQKATEFKNLVMSYMDNPQESEFMDNDDAQGFDIVSSSKDIFLHGLYTVPVTSVLVLLGTIVGFIVYITYLSSTADYTIYELTRDAIGGTAALIILIVTSVRNIFKGYFTFYGFRAKREKELIYLNYGFFKKKKYAIPVDKINAVKIIQPLVSRVLKKYYVEIINVGTGDENNESAGLVLSCSREELEKYMALLLPEFDISAAVGIKRQSPWYFVHKSSQIFVWILSLLIFCFTCSYLIDEVPVPIWILVSGIVFLLVLLFYVLAYLTRGISLQDSYLAASNGIFKKVISFVNYDKIQYLDMKETPVSRLCGECSATAYILASLTNRSIPLCYTSTEDYEQIGEKIVFSGEGFHSPKISAAEE